MVIKYICLLSCLSVLALTWSWTEHNIGWLTEVLTHVVCTACSMLIFLCVYFRWLIVWLFANLFLKYGLSYDQRAYARHVWLNAWFFLFHWMSWMSYEVIDLIYCFLVHGDCFSYHVIYRQLRARRALLLFNDVPLRTRKALLP